MAGVAHMPVEVYLRSSEYEPDAEYVDGEIEERPMGELDPRRLADGDRYLLSQSSERVECPGVSRTAGPGRCHTLRIPDVTVLDRALPREQIITRAPLAVFEILSPEDTEGRLQRKLADYAAMGIPQVWIVDPANARFQRYAEACLVVRAHFMEPAHGIDFELAEIERLLQR